MHWPFPRRSPAKKSGLDLTKMDVGLSRELSRVLAAGGVPTFRQAVVKLFAELDRARRYKRPLAILVFMDDRQPTTLAAGHSLQDAAAAALSNGSALVPAFLASVLREIVREADIVTYAATLGRCIVMMPEVPKADARLALDRIGHICANRLTFSIRAGVAAFPDDGWTLEELIQQAERTEEQTRRDIQTLDASLTDESAAV
jgi:hypothetical protein